MASTSDFFFVKRVFSTGRRDSPIGNSPLDIYPRPSPPRGFADRLSSLAEHISLERVGHLELWSNGERLSQEEGLAKSVLSWIRLVQAKTYFVIRVGAFMKEVLQGDLPRFEDEVREMDWRAGPASFFDWGSCSLPPYEIVPDWREMRELWIVAIDNADDMMSHLNRFIEGMTDWAVEI